MTKRFALCLVLLAASCSFAQGRRWEIEPKADARLKAGKLSVVDGVTNEEGVRFVINNLDIMQPVSITLATEDAAKKLKLAVYKESPQQALVSKETDASGGATAKFRTAESVQLLVSGPAGAKYQLMTWVGPVVAVRTPTAFVPIDKSGSPMVEGVALTPPAQTGAASGGAEKEQEQGKGDVLFLLGPTEILLALIFLALIVLIIVLARGRGKGKGTAAAIILCFLLARPGQTQDPSLEFAPHNVSGADIWKAVNERIGQLREQLDTLEKMGIKVDVEEIKVPHPDDKPEEAGKPPGYLSAAGRMAGQFVTNTKLILAFLEEFGLIDPREAAVQPNYNPPGQPMIPSRCAGSGECGPCFADANAKLDKARKLLEDQYVIYKQTELKAGRIHELANAATGLSPYAQLAWTAIKNNPNEPMNQAQQRFYNVYDSNLEKLLAMSNEGLIGVGACEREHFKDYDWYPRYGMIYYNFLKDRYTRK
jgi:hypothetical protein